VVGEAEVVVRAQQEHGLAIEHDARALRPADHARPAIEPELLELLQALVDLGHVVVALLRPGGFVVNASSYGARTPFFTPPGLLERGFERRGLRTIAVGQVGLGTYYLARRV